MSGPAVRVARPAPASRVALILALGIGGLWAGVSVAQPPQLTPPADVTSPPDPCAETRIDTDRLHFRYVRDDAPVQHEEQNQQEFEAYNEILAFAHGLPVEKLERCANRDVTFADLVRDVRKDYQFKLLYFEGRLKRLRKLEPTKALAEKGVKTLYEGWMFPANGSDPMCVLATELPAGLGPSVEYPTPKPVTVAGYSFKLIRYESAEPDPKHPGQGRIRRAPLLMAHSFRVLPEEDVDAGKAWRTGFVPGILGLVGGISAVALGLTWWFRRGDRRVRTELAVRKARNPFGEQLAAGLPAEPEDRRQAGG